MTRSWHRRVTRLHNHLPLILVVATTIAGALVVIDRIASLGARIASDLAARALL